MSSGAAGATVLRATNFAAQLRREGKYLGEAIRIASRYYKVEYADVQRALASRGGKAHRGTKRPAPPVRFCEEGCGRPAVWRGRLVFGFHTSDVFLCAEHGQRLPSWNEDRPDTVRWTRYRGAPPKDTDGAAP